MTASALIIDDEPDIRELIAMTLSRLGVDCHTAANLDEARNLLSAYAFDVCLTDMKLPDGNGVDFVQELQSSHPTLRVAVITAHGNMQAAVEAMKHGAFDFVSKPVDIAVLRRLVTQAVTYPGTTSASKTDSDTPASGGTLKPSSEKAPADIHLDTHQTSLQKPHFANATTNDMSLAKGHRLVGESAIMWALRRMIVKLGQTNAPVLIHGESGTGKELIAQLIHDNSHRRESPFIAINCGAIPAELMESELFGHRRGSFTGAASDHDGLFLAANGGTLFLDEIAELPLSMQVKLLRAIQERAVRRVGDSQENAVDVRILSASHRDLAIEVDTGKFRHDLFYRLNVIALAAPPLRERQEDIPALVDHVLGRLRRSSIVVPDMKLEASAMARLVKHGFPGNVRELENILERACALTDGSVIRADDLSIGEHSTSGSTGRGENLAQPVRTMGDDERQHLLEVLQEHHWNRKSTAQSLGLTYRQLRYRMERLDIRS